MNEDTSILILPFAGGYRVFLGGELQCSSWEDRGAALAFAAAVVSGTTREAEPTNGAIRSRGGFNPVGG